ncbi:MAG: dehydrogenase [Armatimonadetes bacterium]|nr:dehydrogenase [Armatimonadota bacterium]MDE2207648.1 dehydrogenase [Armatimonadota bacterium]
MPLHSSEPVSPITIRKSARTSGADVTDSLCPYCAVGCGTKIYTRKGQILSIEGNPESPINRGTLCPKGANSFQLAVNPHRVLHALYREPFAAAWRRVSLDWAMERIAQHVKTARDAELDAAVPGDRAVRSIATLGGATLDNEENYLIKKLFTGGLGVLSVENQART